MSFTEIIVDKVEPEGEDIMYILPSKFSSCKYLSSNTFDQATIRNCPVEKITSGGLIGIFSSLKPLGKITIIVDQPIAVMLFYDSKQIEANLKLAGFENIKIEDVTIKDTKTGQQIQTQKLEAEKPESKKSHDVTVEVQKTSYIKPNKEENKKYEITKTTVIESEISQEYKPRGNKTYVKNQVKEEKIEDDKSNSINEENVRPKNRTYVKKEETITTTSQIGNEKPKYQYRKRFKIGNKDN